MFLDGVLNPKPEFLCKEPGNYETFHFVPFCIDIAILHTDYQRSLNNLFLFLVRNGVLQESLVYSSCPITVTIIFSAFTYTGYRLITQLDIE